jgi:peroxiredoxin
MQAIEASKAIVSKVVLGLTLVAATFAHAGPGAASHTTTFTRAVINLENFSAWLQRDRPPTLTLAPEVGEPLWFGEIYRQLPTDPPTSREHNVPFAVRLANGQVVQAWADANMNGDLMDDPAPIISAYPGDPPARSFLTTLRWEISVGSKPRTIERVVRVVVAAPDSIGEAPRYRTQDVYGMIGELDVEGGPRRVVLYDANNDGLYTRGNGDGLFFDLDGDRHFVIDPMATDFGPFATPFPILHSELQVDWVASDGSRVAWRVLGPGRPTTEAKIGRPAPEFSFVDLEGRLQRLGARRGKATVLYFWGSWCASCRRQAEELRGLFARADRSHWDLLGICYDTDRAAALRFRADHRLTFPSSFSGGFPTEDPIGRLYHESGAGVFYVIGADGVLTDRVYEVDEVKDALDRIAARATETSGGR